MERDIEKYAVIDIVTDFRYKICLLASIQINLIEIHSKISEWLVLDVGKGGATDGNNFISGVKNKVAAPKHSVVHRCNEENNFHTISVGDNDINKNPKMICMIFMKFTT